MGLFKAGPTWGMVLWKNPKSRDIDDQEDGAAVRQLATINQRDEQDGKTGKIGEVST